MCGRLRSCLVCVTLLVVEYRRTRSVMMPPFFDDCAATLPLFLLPPITPLSVILYDIGFKLQLINCACVFLSVTTYSYKLATTAPD